MGSRSVAVALLVSGLAAAAAVGCAVRADQLRTEAGWLLERGAAQGSEYAATFENAHAEAQLSILAQRHGVLDGVYLWKRAQLLLILLSVVAAFSSYVLYLFHKLRVSLEEADSQLTHP